MEWIKSLYNRIFAKSEEELLRDKVLNDDIDFANVVSSSLLAKGLYDDLKKQCHPDRFQEEKDINKANELFQLVTQNKGNYAELIFLKERVFKELPVCKKDSI